MKENNQYLATNQTMGLFPIHHPTFQTKIYDRDNIFYSTQSPMEIIEETCLTRGASYEGRVQSVRTMLNYPYKTPLLLCQMEMLCAFPTMSPTSNENVWIFPNHIKYFSKSLRHVSVTFLNDETVTVKCSIAAFTKQYGKTITCQSYFLTHPLHPTPTPRLYIGTRGQVPRPK
ncbi:competence protein ComK [Falsibacillus pallidus]|uniref:Competence protein ComK n=1 Tax=Falsibacillus pallidus TaxID=493781 RepID=A0A370FXX3_9BACI|nr:competence protein ComK [Falsibacillus pallidus]RDI36481.1 competence protein ComK [Falsibacillus pallidus]